MYLKKNNCLISIISISFLLISLVVISVNAEEICEIIYKEFQSGIKQPNELANMCKEEVLEYMNIAKVNAASKNCDIVSEEVSKKQEELKRFDLDQAANLQRFRMALSGCQGAIIAKIGILNAKDAGIDIHINK